MTPAPAPQGRPLRRCLPKSAGGYAHRRVLRALGELNPQIYTKQLWLTPKTLKRGGCEVLRKGHPSRVDQWLTKLVWHQTLKQFCLMPYYSGKGEVTVVGFPNLSAAREAFCREAERAAPAPFGGQHAKP